MKQEALNFYPDLNLVIFAMLLFVFAFSLLIWNLFRKENKKSFEAQAQLPLLQENSNE